MGLDMNMVIEVDYDRGPDRFQDKKQLKCFHRWPYRCARDPDLFDALGDGSIKSGRRSEVEKRALYPSRGIPDVISLDFENLFFHFIVKKGNASRIYGGLSGPLLPPVTPEEAQRLVDDGWSFYRGRINHFSSPGLELHRNVVSNPNYDYPSWLYLSEIHESLDHFGLSLSEMREDRRQHFPIIVDEMRLLEEQVGAGRTRLIFFFDD